MRKNAGLQYTRNSLTLPRAIEIEFQVRVRFPRSELVWRICFETSLLILAADYEPEFEYLAARVADYASRDTAISGVVDEYLRDVEALNHRQGQVWTEQVRLTQEQHRLRQQFEVRVIELASRHILTGLNTREHAERNVSLDHLRLHPSSDQNNVIAPTEVFQSQSVAHRDYVARSDTMATHSVQQGRSQPVARVLNSMAGPATTDHLQGQLLSQTPTSLGRETSQLGKRTNIRSQNPTFTGTEIPEATFAQLASFDQDPFQAEETQLPPSTRDSAYGSTSYKCPCGKDCPEDSELCKYIR